VIYTTFPARDRNELWVPDIEGGNKVKIATGVSLGTGRWAPDNFHLSFQVYGTSAGAKAYIVGADGGGLRQVPHTGDIIWNSVWSPDQKAIYVSGQEKGSPIPTVWKWSVDGSNLEKFTDNCDAVSDIDPGGQYLVGVVWLGEKTGIYEVSTSGWKCTRCFRVW
jgi:Tol biopolymer transport system component